MEKISRKEQLLKELRELENEKPEQLEDLGIQKTDADKTDDEDDEPQTITRAKKPRTEAQMKAFEKAKEKAKLNADKRKAEREAKAKEEQKAIEEKLVKKAVSLKKKQIKEQAILDKIEDDDTPLVEIEKIVKELPAKFKKAVKQDLPVQTPKPFPYIFY
jgi:hypothetical protein